MSTPDLPQVEPIIDPDRVIIDAHHHLWDRPGDTYLLDEYLADTRSGHRIAASVYVQCRSMYRNDGPEELRPIGETNFAAGVAERCAAAPPGTPQVCAAITAFADMTLGPRAASVLEAHLAVARGRLRGIRHISAWDADQSLLPAGYEVRSGLLTSGPFREGVACLAGFGLQFEAFLFHPQLPDLTALARSLPEIGFILNHVGTPLGTGVYSDRKAETFANWMKEVALLAECPNVKVKLGGFGLPWLGLPASRERSARELASSWQPFIDVCVEAFGVQRCMFESNFPVDSRGSSYRELWNAFKFSVAAATETEKEWLFNRTAAQTYAIDKLGLEQQES